MVQHTPHTAMQQQQQRNPLAQRSLTSLTAVCALWRCVRGRSELVWDECDGSGVGAVGALVLLRYFEERVRAADVLRVCQLSSVVHAIAAVAPPSLLSPAASPSALLPSFLIRLAAAVDAHSPRLLRGDGGVTAAEVATALFLHCLQPLARSVQQQRGGEEKEGGADALDRGEERAEEDGEEGRQSKRRRLADHAETAAEAAPMWSTALLWRTWRSCRERVREADAEAADDIERSLSSHAQLHTPAAAAAAAAAAAVTHRSNSRHAGVLTHDSLETGREQCRILLSSEHGLAADSSGEADTSRA